MVTVDKYIRKLIFEHDCVIIPEFGGLLTHHIGAHYDSANGVMVPSRKRLAFNEVLNVDDGLLIYFISVNEKMNREEAAQSVRKYVDSLRASMQAGESVLIDSIGCFATNEEGKIVFEPEQNQNFNNEWYGFKPFRLKQRSDARFSPVGSTTLAAMPITELREEANATIAYEESDEMEVATPMIQWYKWLAAAMLAGAVFTASMVYKTTDSTSLLSTLNPITGIHDLFVTASLWDTQEKESEVVDFTQVVPEAAIAEESQVPETTTLTPTEPFQEIIVEPIAEKPVLEATRISEPVREEVVPVVEKKENKPAYELNKYYLIAGSFGKKSNAVELRGRLIKEGFSGAFIIEDADSKLIKVSSGVYTNYRQALEDKYTIDSITLADSWVYHKR